MTNTRILASLAALALLATPSLSKQSAPLSDTWQFCLCASQAPCGNVSAETGCVNGSGVGASLTATGTTSLAADDLVLSATGLPALLPGQANFGLLLMNDAVSTPFGSLGGVLCIGPGVSRVDIKGTPGGQPMTFGPIVSSVANSFWSPTDFGAGEAWYFQTWYRDPTPQGCSIANFTNGVGALFVP